MMYFCPRCRSRVFTPSAVTLDVVQCGNCGAMMNGSEGIDVRIDKSQIPGEITARNRMFARAELPLPPVDMRAMFSMLKSQLDQTGCDHTRRLTLAWLEARGLDVGAVCVWLDHYGGACDCETLLHCEPTFLDAMRDVDAPALDMEGGR